MDHASRFPESGTRVRSRSRHKLCAFPLHHFPYTIVAAVQQHELAIVAVAHQKRKPGYWRERVKKLQG